MTSSPIIRCCSFLLLLLLVNDVLAREMNCTSSGHVCRPLPDVDGVKNKECMSDRYISRNRDYCPETHEPPWNSSSARPDLPCRPEDGVFRCPDENDNCVRRSQVNKLTAPKESCHRRNRNSDVQFIRMPCSDDEIECKTHNRCVKRFELNTALGCEYESRQVYLHCHAEDEFECKFSHRCIPRHWVRDGSVDCSFNNANVTDTSDEDEPLAECDETREFRCNASGRCIPREWVRDGKRDCPLDGSDETTDPLQCINATEVRCEREGRCIPRYRVNDGYQDCEGGDDVIEEKFHCDPGLEFRCEVENRCIPRQWLRNGIEDCALTGSDEVTDDVTSMTCADDQFRCHDGSRCLDMRYKCDGVQNCPDCSDEIEACSEPRLFRCVNSTGASGSPSQVCIPWAHTCDGAENCPDGSDERTDHMPGFKCIIDQRKCFVPQFLLHLNNKNNVTICPDRRDRCHDDEGEFKCARCLDNTTTIAQPQLCDGIIDCPDLSDECACDPPRGAEPLCVAVLDEGRNRSSSASVCDWQADGGLDERFCEDDEVRDKYEATHGYICKDDVLSRVNLTLKVKPKRAVLCDEKTECLFRDDECMPTCPHMESMCRFGNNPQRCVKAQGGQKLPFTSQETCNGIADCLNGEDEMDCPDRFICDAGVRQGMLRTFKIVSIPMSSYCDLKADCIDQSDELYCEKSNTHFYCKSGEPLFIDKRKCLDGKADCDDRSDECPLDEYDNNPFSDPKELFKNILMRICVWVTGTCSTIANLFVLVFSQRKLQRCRQKNSVAYCNRLLVFNLAFADLLMGVSLFILANKSLQFSGSYCFYDLEWRTSSTCNLIGTLTVISTQTSINILVVLTSLRLYVTIQPMTLSMVRHRLCWILIVLSWMIAFTFATVPLIKSDSFVSAIWIEPSPYFNNTLITPQAKHKYIARSDAMAGHEVDFYGGEKQTDFPTRYVRELGSFGYYSNHSVCFPNLYASPQSPHFSFSLMMVAYNTIAIAFIAGSYVTIYRKSLVRHRPTSPDAKLQVGDPERKTLRRRITVVVVTNNLCLLPICVMACMSFAGYALPPEAYSISSVILLPVNSFLNPVIYSTLHHRFYRKLRSSIERLRARKAGGGRQGDFRLATSVGLTEDVTEQIELNST